MRCPSCASELPDNASFCIRCGKNVLSPDAFAADGGGAAARADATRPDAAAKDGDFLKPGETTEDAEQPLWEGRYSPRAMIGAWLGATFCTIALVAAGIVLKLTTAYWLGLCGLILLGWLYLAGVLLVRRMGVHYQLTSHRLVHDVGILRRVNNRIEVIDMNDITFVQGPIERMLGVGSIRILSSDTSDPTLILRGVEDVANVASIFDAARRKQRTRHGVHVNRI